MAHAKFSPSKLHRILNCPASGQFEDSKRQSSYAEEGEMLHEVVAACLMLHLREGAWIELLKKKDLTVDQFNACEECILYALDLMAKYPPKDARIEHRVFIEDDCDGTADFILISEKRIDIVDWKFGAGVEVSAIDNPQLMAYGVGAIKEAGWEENYHRLVGLHVVQPRLNNYSTDEHTVGSLIRWHQHELAPGLQKARDPKAEYSPGEHCRWCPNKVVCSARLQLAIKDAEEVFAEYAKLPNIPLEAIQKLLPKAEQIEQVIKDLKLYATQQILAGKEVPGFKLVAGRSNRSWVDPDLAAEFLAKHLDPEEMYEMKLLSPAKAEKVLDRAIRKDDEFLALIEKPEGKPTLVVESDKRPPLKLDASSVFQDYTKGE